MTQQHGRRYEHTLSGELVEATTQSVWVATVGYSGNSAIGSSDIVITVDPGVSNRGENIQYNIEAKKRRAKTGKRNSNVFSGSEDDETGVEELLRFINGTPSWATPVIVLSFNQRAPVVLDARVLATWLVDADEVPVTVFNHIKHLSPSPEQETLLEALAPRTTPSDSISMVKPDTDELDSATVSPPEGEVVADVLRLPLVDDGAFNDVSTGVSADD